MATRATFEAASACACARAPARGGSRITASKPVELGAGERRALQVARLGRDAVAEACRARRAAAAPPASRPARRPHAPGSPRRQAAGRRCRSPRTGRRAVARHPRSRPRTAARSCGLGLRARLQEGAGRQRDRHAVERHPDRAARHDHLGLGRRPRAARRRARDPAPRPAPRALAIGKAGRRGASSSRSRPLVGRGDQHLAAAARRAADRPALRAAAAGGAAISGSTTAQAATSTTAWPARPRKPSTTLPPRRSNARRARRRLAGGIGAGGAIGHASRPRRASASATWARCQAASAAGSRCCSWQPPQAPKCGQCGAARGACSCQASGSAPKPPSRARPEAHRQRSPGRASGTNTRRSPRRAMPSPRRAERLDRDLDAARPRCARAGASRGLRGCASPLQAAGSSAAG